MDNDHLFHVSTTSFDNRHCENSSSGPDQTMVIRRALYNVETRPQTFVNRHGYCKKPIITISHALPNVNNRVTNYGWQRAKFKRRCCGLLQLTTVAEEQDRFSFLAFQEKLSIIFISST